MSANVFTRRMYLTLKAMDEGAPAWTAVEAVASVGLSHPDWDMGELRTWDDWESLDSQIPCHVKD